MGFSFAGGLTLRFSVSVSGREKTKETVVEEREHRKEGENARKRTYRLLQLQHQEAGFERFLPVAQCAVGMSIRLC